MKSIIVCLLFFFSVLGYAKDWEINVPRTQLSIPSSPYQINKKDTRVELGFSTWAPSHLIEDSYIPQSTEFKPIHNSPRVSLNLSREWMDFEYVNLWGGVGASVLPLERTGTLAYQNSRYKLSQDLTVYQLRWSLIAQFLPFITEDLRPLVSVSVVPSLRQAQSSEYNSGVSAWDWISETQASLEYRLFKDIYIKGGIDHSVGISSNKLNGTGYFISTEMTLQ